MGKVASICKPLNPFYPLSRLVWCEAVELILLELMLSRVKDAYLEFKR
jgi:hypothetical protein